MGNQHPNTLYYGDNLDILRRYIADESVDLIYLDLRSSQMAGLAQWVVERPVSQQMPKSEGETLVDKDWQWTRNSISRLIRVVCEARLGEAPRYPLEPYRHLLSALLKPLTRDSTQSGLLEDLQKIDPRVHDYLNLAINSPRGIAVEAMLEYARWIGVHRMEQVNGQDAVPGGFDNMPDVKSMLEWQIKPDNASFQANPCIGSRMNVLYWLDKAWLENNAQLIFDLKQIEKDPRRAFGWSAWNAFLVWVRPHIEFYKLFKPQFAYAVDQAATIELPADSGREQPMLHLGEHLLLFYGRGQLSLDDDGGLLRRFIRESQSKIRKYAMRFVGSSLRGDEKIPQEIVDRFIALWEWYWPSFGHEDVKDDPRSGLYGEWFCCGQFPHKWALEQLWNFVQVVPMPEPDNLVMGRLVEIAGTDIGLTMRILDRMVRGDAEGWRVSAWKHEAKKILSLAMQEEGKVREDAESLIDFLGRRGFIEFGELLRDDLRQT